MFAGSDEFAFKYAAQMRNQPTHAEDIMWCWLRQKPNGYKFRRQHPFANYILDFYCHRLQLVIEIDGSIHEDPVVHDNDIIREAFLLSRGLNVLRFTNEQVCKELHLIMHKLQQIFEQGHV